MDNEQREGLEICGVEESYLSFLTALGSHAESCQSQIEESNPRPSELGSPLFALASAHSHLPTNDIPNLFIMIIQFLEELGVLHVS
jgi:hypothetical protein